MKIFIPHPHIKPHHVKHAAAGSTILGGVVEIFSNIPHLGTVILVVAACVAIYEPHIVHEIEIEDDADV